MGTLVCAITRAYACIGLCKQNAPDRGVITSPRIIDTCARAYIHAKRVKGRERGGGRRRPRAWENEIERTSRCCFVDVDQMSVQLKDLSSTCARMRVLARVATARFQRIRFPEIVFDQGIVRMRCRGRQPRNGDLGFNIRAALTRRQSATKDTTPDTRSGYAG